MLLTSILRRERKKTAYIRWNCNAPHGNTGHAAGEDDGTEVEVGCRRACWRQSFLRYFVAYEVPGCEVQRQHMLPLSTAQCKLGHKLVHTLRFQARPSQGSHRYPGRYCGCLLRGTARVRRPVHRCTSLSLRRPGPGSVGALLRAQSVQR